MVEALANRISIYLVSIQAAKEEDREIIAYGLFNILADVQQISILLILGLLLHMAPEITVYSLCFVSLKRYIGGAHATKHWICLVLYTSTAFACCFICVRLVLLNTPLIAVGMLISMLLLVFARAPVPHYNNPLSKKKRRKMRKRSITIAFTQAAVIAFGIVFLPEQAARYILCGSAGGLSAAITLILPMPNPDERR